MVAQSELVPQIETELKRIGAVDIQVQALERPPEHAPHVRLALRDQSCLVEAEGLLQVLKTIPDQAGLDCVCEELQDHARHGTKWATQ